MPNSNLEHAAANQRPAKRYLVRVLQIAASWKSARRSRNRHAQRRQQAMQVGRCGLPRQIEVRSNDDLVRALMLHSFDKFADLELVRPDAFDR